MNNVSDLNSLDLQVISNSENWRWSKPSSLENLTRRRKTLASFQIESNDDLDFLNNFNEFPQNKQNIFNNLEILAKQNYIANWNLINTKEQALRFSINENYPTAITVYCDIQGERFLEFSRLEIVVAENIKTSICLDFSAKHAAAQISVIELILEKNSHCELLLIGVNSAENSTESGAQLINFYAHQDENSNLKLNVAGDGDFFRTDLHVLLNGEYANFSLAAAQKAKKNSLHDLHVKVEHNYANCTSSQIMRGVLEKESQGIFDGLIYVCQNASKTNAAQNSRYLLLDTTAQALAIPRLEIYTDDVKCSHGATSGQLDQQALFYLCSRGISKDEAKKMLIKAFLAQTDQLSSDYLKNIWKEFIDIQEN